MNERIYATLKKNNTLTIKRKGGLIYLNEVNLKYNTSLITKILS